MELNEFLDELKGWKLTWYKIINFAIGLSSLLIYEFIGRPIYRPYVYRNDINDFHLADTLGNTFGTLTTLFILIAIFSHERDKGNYLIKLGTLSIIVYELAHPLLGKPIDVWDIAATFITGIFSYFLYNAIFKNRSGERKITSG
ncbi:hypothetical protein [Robertkochia aurantiaca]|uniref:hypothetical protein n=1 Tax=Robertkochia aurantiaca TaxID=2873700 RepID=UPI001CC93B7D|nr:hypothetical protein [Robertkochia sp. 3YJGBD-33]